MVRNQKRFLALFSAAALTVTSVVPSSVVYAENGETAVAEGAVEQDTEKSERNSAEKELEETQGDILYNSDFSGWEIVAGPSDDKSGEVKVADGEMELNGFTGIAVDTKAPVMKDGSVTAKIKADQLQSLMLVFRYQDKDNFASMGFGTNNVMFVSRKDGNERYNIADFSYDYGNKEYVTLKCSFQGDKIQLFIDGKFAAEWTGISCTDEGKVGIRTWGSAKNVKFSSLSCTNIMLNTEDLVQLIKEAKTYDKNMYTPETWAIFEKALEAAEKALSDASVQSEIDTAKNNLQDAIESLSVLEEDRIDVTEDYNNGTAESVWSEKFIHKENALAFSVDAGKTVYNENAAMQQVENGLYTYKVKTDSQGRFGVSFNGNVLYSKEKGSYTVSNQKGEAVQIAEGNLKLSPDTWYEIKVLKNMDTLRLYINGAIVVDTQMDNLTSEPGKIGLYNPSDADMEMLIRTCGVYELFSYVNDFSDESQLGEWETEKAEVTYESEGQLNGSGEAKIQLNGVARAIAKSTPKISDGIYEFDMRDNAAEGTGRFGFMFRATGLDRFEFIYHDVGTTWGIRTKMPGSATEWAQEVSLSKGGKFTENENHHVRMVVEGDNVKIWLDNESLGAVNLSRRSQKGHFGFMKWYNAAEFRLDNLTIKETVFVSPEIPDKRPVALENDSLKVTFDENFPYIIKYEMNGKELTGNPEGQNAVIINGDTYYPIVSCKKADEKTLVYSLEIPSINMSMDIHYELDKNDIKMTMENVQEGKVKLETFQFKDDVLATTGNDMDTSSMGMTVYTTGPTGYPTMLDTLYENMNDAVVGGTNQSYAMLASDGLAMTVNNNTINTRARFTTSITEQNGVKKGQIGNGAFDYVLPGSDKIYMPSAVITICEDINDDKEVNYQDAAVNYKHIRSKVYGDDVMKDNVTWIAYNSVSQAQEPFMRSLDLGKEVYNFTDGFEQMIMHKGYQAEGHDTQHGMYAYNTGERQGGSDDFKAVMEAGKKYGIKYGIHTNVNEHHVESMNEDVMRKPLSPGWGLWSQAYWVDQGKDVVSGNREQRLRMLKEEYPDLKFIYYDIYGNDGAPVWMGQSLAEVTNDMDMILATEFNGPLEQQAAFTHWGNDPDYANVGNESKLMRYFKNDTDIYIGNALLMGNKMLNIGTWQAMNTDMKRGVDTFYNNTLITKYLQHYDLMDYEDDYAVFSNGVKTERKGNIIEMTKDGKKMASWTWEHKANSYGQMQEVTGDATLLLPWYAKDSKEKNPDEASKLYYWNPAGGSTTWDVSMHEGWKDGTKADIYRLTTDEKEKVGTVTVSDGQITMNQEPGYGYVLYPKGEKPEKAVVNFGEGTPLKDPNFINDEGKSWKLKGDAALKKDDGYNPYLAFEGEGKASQHMKGLKSGKTYTVYGFADINENSKLKMSVTVDGKVYEKEYGPSELVYRGIPRYADQNKHTQKVRIVFDVPEGVTDAKLTFEGNGAVRLQDLRVWENITRTPQITDEGMEDYILYEDFENVEQGYGPFILDKRHTGWDAPVQIAEYRESRPEYGEEWKQYSDYVANGRYSLKTDIGGNGFDVGNTANGIIYRSIPGSVEFEKNTEYEIAFKYVTGVDDRHNIQICDSDGNVVYEYVFKATQREEGKHSLATAEQTATFKTGDRDDYYIVVNLIDNKAGLEPRVDENGSIMERCFLSLDDISIKKVSEKVVVDKSKLEKAVEEAEAKDKKEYTKKSWKDFEKALKEANTVYEDKEASQEAVDTAVSKLTEKMNALQKVKPKKPGKGNHGNNSK